MRKTLIVLLALFVPATIWATDINQGKFELSGKSAFDFSSVTTKVSGVTPDVKTDMIAVQLDGNYYVIKNLGLGAFVQYARVEVAGVEGSTLFIGPQAIYNFPVGDQVSLFVNAGVGYASTTVAGTDSTGWGFEAGGGLKFFVGNSASVNVGAAYQYLTLESGDIKDSGVKAGVGLSLYF